jgi:hypothetical protein
MKFSVGPAHQRLAASSSDLAKPEHQRPSSSCDLQPIHRPNLLLLSVQNPSGGRKKCKVSKCNPLPSETLRRLLPASNPPPEPQEVEARPRPGAGCRGAEASRRRGGGGFAAGCCSHWESEELAVACVRGVPVCPAAVDHDDGRLGVRLATPAAACSPLRRSVAPWPSSHPPRPPSLRNWSWRRWLCFGRSRQWRRRLAGVNLANYDSVGTN